MLWKLVDDDKKIIYDFWSYIWYLDSIGWSLK